MLQPKMLRRARCCIKAAASERRHQCCCMRATASMLLRESGVNAAVCMRQDNYSGVHAEASIWWHRYGIVRATESMLQRKNVAA